MKKQIRLLAGMMAMSLILVSCEEPEPAPQPTPEKTVKTLQFTAAEQELVQHCNDFSFNLLTQVAQNETQENIVLSPLSASMLLGMLMNGADGQTLAQIQAVTGFSSHASIESINAYYRQLIDVLPNLDSCTTLGLANGIWARQDFPVYPAFTNACKQSFDAQAKNVPTFLDDEVIAEINRFAADHTNNRIKEILKKEMVTENTVMALMNALYFKALWETQFDKEYTYAYPFATLGGTEIKTDMMNKADTMSYAEGSDYQLLELPYKGGKYCVDLVLPAKGADINAWLKTLDGNKWQTMLAGTSSEDVVLMLPKFCLHYDRTLTEDLQALGMIDAFSRLKANFSLLSSAPTYVSLIKQKTFLQVDEEGTEAAAVTIGVVEYTSAGPSNSKYFTANRPFLFVIRERDYGTILFTALIGHPEWEE